MSDFEFNIIDTLIRVLILVPIFIFNGWCTIKLYHWDNNRRDMKFLKHLKIEYPDSVIILSSVSSSDRESLNKLKEKLDADSRPAG